MKLISDSLSEHLSHNSDTEQSNSENEQENNDIGDICLSSLIGSAVRIKKLMQSGPQYIGKNGNC